MIDDVVLEDRHPTIFCFFFCVWKYFYVESQYDAVEGLVFFDHDCFCYVPF